MTALPIETLEIGDFLPDFQLPNQRRNVTVLSRKALGKSVIVLFYPDHDKPACQQQLRSFAELYDDFDAVAHIFAVSSDTPDSAARAAQNYDLPFPFILSDAEARVAAAYGVAHNLDTPVDFMGAGAFSVFVADPNRRIVRIDRNIADGDYAAKLLHQLRDAPARAPREMGMVAPVLYVPRVFTPDFCRRLIDVYETQGNAPTGVQQNAGAGGAAQVFDADAKVRRDHTVTDRALNEELKAYIGKRVIPEVLKAFAYQVTHYEVFKIACYDGADGGFFRPHRDNTSASTAHRRFAMTLNLNTGEYEGGQLRFPEFGPDLYAPGVGDAVVFSCSLLHEATAVTSGRRFALLAFFYGSDGQRMFDRNRDKATMGRPGTAAHTTA